MKDSFLIPKVSILKEEQVYGNNKLKIFEVIKKEAAVTDTAILRGAKSMDYHVDGDNTLSGRTNAYWLQNSDRDGNTCGVHHNGSRSWTYCNNRYVGVRAALPYSQIRNLPHNVKRRNNGLYEITYGYYPDEAQENMTQVGLNFVYISGNLKNLGTGCTFDGRRYNEYDKGFMPEEQTYFEYNGEIYTRIRANSCFDNEDFTLSNGEKYKYGDYVWTKVKPITWLKHPDDDIMISEKEILAGVRFYKSRGGYNGDFNKTELKWFLDNYLSKEIIMFNPMISKYLNVVNDDTRKTKKHYVDLYKNNKPVAKIKVKSKTKK